MRRPGNQYSAIKRFDERGASTLQLQRLTSSAVMESETVFVFGLDWVFSA